MTSRRAHPLAKSIAGRLTESSGSLAHAGWVSMTQVPHLPRLPLVDVARQHQDLEDQLSAAFARVLDSSRFILGDEVSNFEEEIAAYLGVKFALGVSSGSDALSLALKAVGVGPGDEVITTPFSFFAGVGSILGVGATPRFADIEPDGFNLAVDRVEALIGPRTRAVLCVHLFGDPAAAKRMRALCDARGLFLIEDAAQAMGASCDGARVGSIGHLGCFSFFPSKPLGGLGDGGLITTSDPALAERCRLLRSHGAASPHQHELLGGNHRLDALQAAFLRVKLPHLDNWRVARARHVEAYDLAFSACPVLIVPRGPRAGELSAHAHYTLRVVRPGSRAALQRGLALRGIDSAMYYEGPIYRQPLPELRRGLNGREASDCPNTEQRVHEVLSIPLFAGLTLSERDHVVSMVLECLSES